MVVDYIYEGKTILRNNKATSYPHKGYSVSFMAYKEENKDILIEKYVVVDINQLLPHFSPPEGYEKSALVNNESMEHYAVLLMKPEEVNNWLSSSKQ